MVTEATKRPEVKKIRYDSKSDVLYISCGKRRPGIALEVRAGDLVRIDPYTDEVVGITIMNFRERYMSSASNNIEKSAKSVYPKILNALSRSRCKC
jgi:uncharacterized protein YuzE